jgi:hypothetical protein
MPLDTLLPIFAYFLIGFLLRFRGLAGSEQAAFLFRLAFYVTLPALVFLVISGAEFDSGAEFERRTIFLPIAGITVNLVCTAAAIFFVRMTKIDNRQAGAVVLGAGIMNTAFVLSCRSSGSPHSPKLSCSISAMPCSSAYSLTRFPCISAMHRQNRRDLICSRRSVRRYSWQSQPL